MVAHEPQQTMALNSNAGTLARYKLCTACFIEHLALRGHDNFCSTVFAVQNLGRRRRLSPRPGYAPAGNSDRWLRGFDAFVAIANW